jgi:hypothetical protein
MTYEDFIEQKVSTVKESGFDATDLSNHLFEFQSFIVKRALKKGRYAIFADCGLGKTIMQLEWAVQVAKHTNSKVLILAPLAVTSQTEQEAVKFGYDLSMIDIYNYEKLHNIDPTIYAGIVLDESSILKNFEGKIKKQIIDSFSDTPYKLACTATPSPNDPMEIGNHSEFLNVMSRSEMLAMFFVHDGGDTSQWRIKGHAYKKFYHFIASWAVMLNRPEDIGFHMDGYSLPGLNMIEHKITTPKRDNESLFNDMAVSATNFNQELRNTRHERMKKAAEIANATNEQVIIWIKHNDEGKWLTDNIPDAIEVKGSDDPELKKKSLLGFADGDFRVLVTKSKIAQFGLNYQNCHIQIFASLDFSFEALYQSIRRSYRFGQQKPVDIHIITTDTMQNVIQSINDKQKLFLSMQQEMADTMNENLKGNISMMKADFDTIEEKNEFFHIKRGDCIQLIKEVPDESIGFSIFSPPFADLYTYSSHIEDMGNSKDYKEFLIHFKFLVDELYRVVMSGRNVAVHCMDLPIQKGKEGFIGLRDFSGLIRDAFESSGFIYHSRVTIWKDPVVEMQRTKALGLLHKQVLKDSTMSRVGIPDYLMIFRKDGVRDNPVHCNIPVDLWQKYASPVWYDINYSDTLQYRSARADEDEKHICPLQLPTIERAIHLYTNDGDTVFTPFMGIGSEVYQAVKMNRYGIGFELKESYFSTAKKNIMEAVEAKNQLALF